MRVLLVIALCCASGVVLASPPHKSMPAPQYTIDMDLAPQDRWAEVARDYSPDFVSIKSWFLSSFGLSEKTADDLFLVFDDVDRFLPEPFSSEIKGFAGVANQTVGFITVMNLIYDLTAGCTSIVAQHTNGTMVHGRNLDYGCMPLRPITIEVAFQQAGETKFKGTTFAGYIGLLTGMRQGGLSVTIDQRSGGQYANYSHVINQIIDMAEGVLDHGRPIGFLVRDQIQFATGFEAAVSALSAPNLHTMAPVYLILAGISAGQGAVITRDRNSAVDVWRIGAQSGRWFLVETNYDHWLPAPKTDNRRGAANKGMHALGQENLSWENLFDVLSTPPVLNDGTKYTILATPATGDYASWIRYDDPLHGQC